MTKDFEKTYDDAAHAMLYALYDMAIVACEKCNPAAVHLLMEEYDRITNLEQQLRLHGCLKG